MGILIFILSTIISFFLNRSFKFIIGTFNFWTKDTNGISSFINEVISILGGKWLPIDFFGPLSSIIKLLPFSYGFYFPIQILINSNLDSNDILKILFLEILWTIVFTLVGYFLWKRGLKKFESVGI